jgi:hypothetical protein
MPHLLDQSVVEGSPVVEIIALIAAASPVAVAAFRYLTVKAFVKHANKKDLPAIARAMYPRLHLGRGRQPDQEARQDGEPSTGEPDRGS